jgi:hypothetical protein
MILLGIFIALTAQPLTAQTKPTDTDGDGFYNISTLDHLRWVSENDSSWTWNFELDNDIDASDTRNWNFGDHDGDTLTPDSAMGWRPIGNSTFKYSGKFDGHGNEIINLYIFREKEDNIGLIGYIENGTISNLGMVNCDIFGAYHVGGLCGRNYGGTINNSYTTGLLAGNSYVGGICAQQIWGIISNSFCIAEINGKSYVGGVCGDSYYGTITNSYANGTVSGMYSGVGGLCGRNDIGSIINCFATSDVTGNWDVGGICGFNGSGGCIVNSYATGAVSGSSDFIGGLCGSNSRGSITTSYATGAVVGSNCVGGLCGSNINGCIADSYSIGFVHADSNYVGGFLGYDVSDSGYFSGNFWDIQRSGLDFSYAATGKKTAEMQTETTFTSSGWNFTRIWNISNSTNDGYPHLRPRPEVPTKSGDTFLISDIGDLLWLSMSSEAWASDFLVTCNIEASETSTWGSVGAIPIGLGVGFRGKFDGAGYEIYNLYIDRPHTDFVGLFGHVRNGIIAGIGVVDCNISGFYYAGAVCGRNIYGKIEYSYSTGIVAGNSNYVGGLCGGISEGIISNSFSRADVTGNAKYIGGLSGAVSGGKIYESFATGDVQGKADFVGGLCGYNNYGSISNCYATGGVEGSYYVGGLFGYNYYGSISNCYGISRVSGDDNIGGFLAHDDRGNGTFSGNFWDKETSGIDTSAAGTGLTTAQMQTRQTFLDAGWDFDSTWALTGGLNDGYPFFKSQYEQDSQTLPLKKGWNMISSRIIPEIDSSDAVFAGISDNLFLAKNSRGKLILPDYGINQIPIFDVEEGLLLHMTGADTLTIEGFKVPCETEIDLRKGWNMIPYFCENERNIDSLLNEIIGNIFLMKNGKGSIYLPDYGIDQIETLKPGEGYLIYMKDEDILVYPGE